MSRNFKSFTDMDAAIHNARVAAGKGGDVVVSGVPTVGAGDDDEEKLKQQVRDYCKQRRWYYVESRTDMPTTTALGVPDFCIAADSGKTHWIETKGPKTKVTREQEGTMHWLQGLGHNADIVRSFPEFLAVIYRDADQPPTKEKDMEQ